MEPLLKERTQILQLTPRQTREQIQICFCIDRNYVQHVGAAMTSIAINNHEVDIEFHIICNALEKSEIEKFSALSGIYNRNINLYFIDELSFIDLGTDANLGHISPATYYRFAIPSVLPDTLNKVLYLDADTISNSSLLDVWLTDIDDVPLAAWGLSCEEFKHRSDLTEREKSFKQFLEERIDEIDLSSGSYCNAGIMLINLDIWRRDSIASKAIEFIKDKKPRFMDQDGINKVIDGNFRFLNKKWNYPIRLDHYETTLPPDAAILHFVSTSKPWHKSPDPRKEIYWEYIRRSPWSDAYTAREKTIEEAMTERLASTARALIKKARQLKKLTALVNKK